MYSEELGDKDVVNQYIHKQKVSSQELLNGNVTPVTLLPDPKSGTYIKILDIEPYYIFRDSAYATNTNIAIRYKGASSDIATITGILSNTASHFAKVSFNSGNVVLPEVGIEMYVPNGNPSSGNSVVDFYITYAFVTLLEEPGDITAPELLEASVDSAAPNEVILQMSESVNLTTAGWSISTDSVTAINLTGVTGNGNNNPTLVSDRDIEPTETLTIGYDGAVTTDANRTEDLAGNPLADITSDPVVNNVLPKLNTPTISLSNRTTSSITVSWTNVSNESGYRLQISSDGGSTWPTEIDLGVDVVSYQDTGLSSGQTKHYRVRALGDDVNFTDSDWSNILEATTNAEQLATPTNFGAVADGSDIVNLSWSDVNNESGYELQVSTDEGATYSVVATLGADVISYQDSGLAGGTTYYYRLRALGDGVSYTNSNWTVDTVTTAEVVGSSAVVGVGVVGQATVGMKLPAPTGVAANGTSSTEIEITWTDNSTRETGYQVEVSTDGINNWTVLNQTAENITSYIHSGLNSNTTRYYRVKTIGDDTNYEDSEYSSVVNGTTLIDSLDTPVLSVSGTTSSSISLSWTNVSNEDGYTIEHSTDNGATWLILATVTADITSYSDTGLSSGVTKHYRVKATSASLTDSAYSNVVSDTTDPIKLSTPANFIATTLSSSSIGLDWDDVNNESGYTLEKSTDGGANYSLMDTVPAGTINYTVEGQQSDTTFHFRIKATGDGVSYSDSDWVSDSATTNVVYTSYEQILDNSDYDVSIESFGWKVALSGDLMLVGAENSTQGGRVFPFVNSPSVGAPNNWLAGPEIVDPDNGDGGSFQWGHDFDIRGPYAAVSFYDTVNNNGYVYVFELDGSGTILSSVRIDHPDGLADHRFGASVALDGDILYIGDTWTGTIYTYLRGSGNTWSRNTNASYAADPGNIGLWAHAQDGLLVFTNTNTNDVYVYDNNNGIPNQVVVFSSDTGYGRPAAVSSNLVAIGWPGYPTSAGYVDSEGRAEFKTGDVNDNFGDSEILSPGTLTAGDRFGKDIAIVGYTSGEIYAVVGAFEGSDVYIYKYVSPDWAEIHRFNKTNTKFGYSLDIDTSRLVVGAFVEGTSTGGKVHVYSK